MIIIILSTAVFAVFVYVFITYLCFWIFTINVSLTDISWGFVLFLEQLSSRKSLDDCYCQSYFSIVGRTHETLDNRKTWDIIKVQIKTNLLIKKSTGCNRIPILRSSNEEWINDWFVLRKADFVFKKTNISIPFRVKICKLPKLFWWLEFFRESYLFQGVIGDFPQHSRQDCLYGNS